MRPSPPPAASPTGPHPEAPLVSTLCAVGEADVASNHVSRFDPGTETQTRFPGPLMIDVGLVPTAYRFRTAPEGVLRTTEPGALNSSATQKLPSGPRTMPLVADWKSLKS